MPQDKTGLALGQRTIGSVKRLNDFYAELPVTLAFDSTPGQLVAFLTELRRRATFFNRPVIADVAARSPARSPERACRFKKCPGQHDRSFPDRRGHR